MNAYQHVEEIEEILDDKALLSQKISAFAMCMGWVTFMGVVAVVLAGGAKGDPAFQGETAMLFGVISMGLTVSGLMMGPFLGRLVEGPLPSLLREWKETRSEKVRAVFHQKLMTGLVLRLAPVEAGALFGGVALMASGGAPGQPVLQAAYVLPGVLLLLTAGWYFPSREKIAGRLATQFHG